MEMEISGNSNSSTTGVKDREPSRHQHTGDLLAKEVYWKLNAANYDGPQEFEQVLTELAEDVLSDFETPHDVDKIKAALRVAFVDMESSLDPDDPTAQVVDYKYRQVGEKLYKDLDLQPKK